MDSRENKRGRRRFKLLQSSWQAADAAACRRAAALQRRFARDRHAAACVSKLKQVLANASAPLSPL